MLGRISARLDAALDASGKALSVLPLLLILIQFAVVLSIYVFSSGNIQLQESLQYVNALMFLGGAGYTAFHDEHVRVDLFYSKFSVSNKAKVDFFGTLFLLIPFLTLFWITSLPYVIGSWQILEASVESAGLPFVYILKSTLLLFALTMSMHAVSALIRSYRVMREAD